jgi:prolyl-tRNA editing enzyme YbaK/EbsC (Cys-tRNA(Pro) deacylase)
MKQAGIANKKAQFIQQLLLNESIDSEVVELPKSTRTVKDAALAIGCSESQIAKSIMFMTVQTGQLILVVACGTNRINEKRISQQISEPVKQARADLIREQTGYSIGGVPPCGHSGSIKTFLDEDLLRLDRIWAAAGTPNAVFSITPSDLHRLTGGIVMHVAT